MKEAEQLLESLVADKISRVGQLEILRSAAGFVLCHRDDVERGDLETCEIDDAFELTKFDDAGNYRPLKTAPNLRHGWKIFVQNFEQAWRVIDAMYPARLAVLRAFKSGRLTTTSLRETLNRQTGMYRAAAKISDEQIDEVVGNFCRSDGGCLRTILWKRDPSGEVASAKLPTDKFDPAFDQFAAAKNRRPTIPKIVREKAATAGSMPLLCQEACNLLVAECRRVVRMEGAASSASD